MWLYRTGSVGGQLREIDVLPMFQRIDNRKAVLIGMGGEVARGCLWRRADLTTSNMKMDVDPRTLLRIARLPETDELINHVELWRDAVPCENGLQLLDLFFLENQLGCIGCTSNPAYAGIAAFELWPDNNRRILELMLSLPVSYRKEQRFSKDIIKLCWPELLEFHMNKWDFRYKISNTISNPAWVFKKILRNFVGNLT